MDLGWTEEQAQLRATMVEFARAELNDGLMEREARGEFHREGWRRCAQMGVHGLPVPAEYGGMGLDALTTMGVLESLGEGCKDNGLVFSINAHMWTLEMPLLGFGTEEQKRRWLPRLCGGELIGGNAMSEPGSGSDAYALATRAEKRGDRYRLTGSKVFVSNGPIADLYLVFATVDPALGPNGVSAFLVERDTPGLTVGSPVHKMGLKTSPMSELFFDGCEIPADHLLGREGAGKNLFTDSMTWERSCILAGAVGAMQRLLDTTVRYASQRKQFGQPIAKFQLVASRLVDMKIRLETSRALLYRAGWMKDRGRSIFLEAAMAKLHISESWVASAQDAVQIHGGYGYMAEYEVERELRDAIASRLYSGTSEIQRLIIAPLLGV
jgi:alkylation response protein AidB-like acyl-CoA dehydrogenase